MSTDTKLFQGTVIILLVFIFASVWLVPFSTSRPSADCLAAMESASKTVDAAGEFLNNALTDYSDAAYVEAENINQQTFRAAEYGMTIQHMTALTELAALRVQVACR